MNFKTAVAEPRPDRPATAGLGEREAFRLRDLLPAASLGGAVLILTIAKTLATLPADGSVAVVFPPWSDARANWSAIAAADGRVVRQIAGGTILVAASATPGLADRLRDGPALALINPGAVGGCWTPPPSQTPFDPTPPPPRTNAPI